MDNLKEIEILKQLIERYASPRWQRFNEEGILTRLEIVNQAQIRLTYLEAVDADVKRKGNYEIK